MTLVQRKGSKCCADGLNNIKVMWKGSSWRCHRIYRGYKLFGVGQNSLSRPEKALVYQSET